MYGARGSLDSMRAQESERQLAITDKWASMVITAIFAWKMGNQVFRTFGANSPTF